VRAIWSFWTKPFRARQHYQWLRPEHYFLSWVLSIQTAREHFAKTALYTDDEGARLLVDGLGLEFDQVSTELNPLSKFDEKFWALGKVVTYGAQTEPFVHLDSDVFLWKPLPARLTSAPLLAQCPDYFVLGASYYRPEALERSISLSGNIWLPAEWVWYRAASSTQRGESCGIFGGHRLDFIQHYARQALKLLEHPDNARGWSMMAPKMEKNILFEQYLLAACIAYHQHHSNSPYRDIEIRYLFESFDEAFHDVSAERAGYTHLISNSKGNPEIAGDLEARVKREYPDYYDRCLKLVANGNGRVPRKGLKATATSGPLRPRQNKRT
jgi:Family of unknown function (DUF6734)